LHLIKISRNGCETETYVSRQRNTFKRNFIKYLWEVRQGDMDMGTEEEDPFRPSDRCKSVVCLADIDAFVFPSVHRQTTICNTQWCTTLGWVKWNALPHRNIRDKVFPGRGCRALTAWEWCEWDGSWTPYHIMLNDLPIGLLRVCISDGVH